MNAFQHIYTVEHFHQPCVALVLLYNSCLELNLISNSCLLFKDLTLHTYKGSIVILIGLILWSEQKTYREMIRMCCVIWHTLYFHLVYTLYTLYTFMTLNSSLALLKKFPLYRMWCVHAAPAIWWVDICWQGFWPWWGMRCRLTGDTQRTTNDTLVLRWLSLRCYISEVCHSKSNHLLGPLGACQNHWQVRCVAPPTAHPGPPTHPRPLPHTLNPLFFFLHFKSQTEKTSVLSYCSLWLRRVRNFKLGSFQTFHLSYQHVASTHSRKSSFWNTQTSTSCFNNHVVVKVAGRTLYFLILMFNIYFNYSCPVWLLCIVLLLHDWLIGYKQVYMCS